MAECGKICFTNVVCIRTAFLMDLGKLNPSIGGKKRGKNVLLFFAFKNCTQLLLPQILLWIQPHAALGGCSYMH